jgi:dethiobiotin synthetase
VGQIWRRSQAGSQSCSPEWVIEIASKKSGVFLTGTDTGVGKTLVSCLLIAGLRRLGLDVGVMKPYASGGWHDARALQRAAGNRAPLKQIVAAFLPEPLAPAAAPLLRRNLPPFSKVLQTLRKLQRRHPFVVVEGIGGALAPLRPGLTVADMAKRFGFPVWIVARPGLGTLNHTLMTVEVLRRRGVGIGQIILSGLRGKSLAERTNPVLLRRLTGLPVLCLPPIKTAAQREKYSKILAGPWAR